MATFDLKSFKLTPSAVFLILANAIPILGIFLFGWDAVTILVLYWLESVIIGGLNVIKILSVRSSEDTPKIFFFGNLFIAAFFTVHYGIFTMVHGMFLKEVFGAEFIFEDLKEGGPLLWTALSFLVSHVFSMVVNFYGKAEYIGRPAIEQMFTPYGRVFVMHFVILLGGFAVQMLGDPLIAVIMLIVLKTGIDLAAHNKEHQAREAITT